MSTFRTMIAASALGVLGCAPGPQPQPAANPPPLPQTVQSGEDSPPQQVQPDAPVTGAEEACAELPVTDGMILWLRAARGIRLDEEGNVEEWRDLGELGNHFEQEEPSRRPTVISEAGTFPSLFFDGEDDLLRNLSFQPDSASELTVFLVAAPLSNPLAGSWPGLLSFTRASEADYYVGLNIDQGQDATDAFQNINVEGAKGGGSGGVDLMESSFPFGTFGLLTVTYGADETALYVNGSLEGERDPSPAWVQLGEGRVGGRYFSDERAFLHGRIGEILVYSRALSEVERTEVEACLASRYGT